MCVVALCSLENDCVHAGYLALALYFFRARIRLRARRNRQAISPLDFLDCRPAQITLNAPSSSPPSPLQSFLVATFVQLLHHAAFSGLSGTLAASVGRWW